MPSSLSFGDFLNTIADRGRSIIGIGADGRSGKTDGVVRLCSMLLSRRGEAAGIALSQEILLRYRSLDQDGKKAVFQSLKEAYSIDQESVKAAAAAYLDAPDASTLANLSASTRSPRAELVRRLNQAPGATLGLVNMRADLLGFLRDEPELKAVDTDFVENFVSWFNRGFLELRRIDWQTPAAILEKIIEYEAVHGMEGWADLRERIDPEDRCIYGFFHPRLPDEPLIFVEVALLDKTPATIDTILGADRKPVEAERATTAVFYSISNCQRGLRGVPLGNFLIKQVVEDLRGRFPHLKTFVTLSPIPGFRSWLTKAADTGEIANVDATNAAMLAIEEENTDTGSLKQAEAVLMPAVAHYLMNAKDRGGKPDDPVARFHLGNGAELGRLNWAAQASPSGVRQSFGIMANYRYKLSEIESNHERFAESGEVSASSSVNRLARSFGGSINAKQAVEASG